MVQSEEVVMKLLLKTGKDVSKLQKICYANKERSFKGLSYLETEDLYCKVSEWENELYIISQILFRQMEKGGCHDGNMDQDEGHS